MVGNENDTSNDPAAPDRATLLLWWMSERGDCTTDRLRNALDGWEAVQEENDKDVYRLTLRRRLVELGHAEPDATDHRRWHILPPYLLQLPQTETPTALLCGARTGDWQAQVQQTVARNPALRLDIQPTEEQDAPPRWAVSVQDSANPAPLQSLAAALNVPLVTDGPRRLCVRLTPFADVIKAAPVYDLSVYEDQSEGYDVQRAGSDKAWVPGMPLQNSPLRRVTERFGPPSYLLRVQKQDGTEWRRIPREADAIWCAAPALLSAMPDKPLLYYDPATKQVRTRARLPEQVSRILALCTGYPPRRVQGEYTYNQVPADLAHAVAWKMGLRLPK